MSTHTHMHDRTSDDFSAQGLVANMAENERMKVSPKCDSKQARHKLGAIP